MQNLINQYGQLLSSIDNWFNKVMESFPEHINCGKGCSGCCRGLFDITLLDALYLQQGFTALPDAIREVVLKAAKSRVNDVVNLWPDFSHPFLLNSHSEEEWQYLMPEDDETPCVLLDNNGDCLVYSHRPMTCRLHGLPLLDLSGEIMHDEWCTENFTDIDPLLLDGIKGDFDRYFREEVRLDRELSMLLYNRVIYELDTLIPAALLIDFEKIRT